MKRWVRFAPLALFALLLAGLAWRLAVPADPVVRSKLVGEQVPDVVLAPLAPNAPGIALRSITGKPLVVNFFASWCVPCIAEAPLLSEMKRQGVPILGIAVRDRPEDVATFLARHGNPYSAVGADPESQVQIALGSSGVPESYVVDGRGIIRYQHVGPIERKDLPTILAKVESAR
ncbi:MAG: DsbE family thiol:disulfide interchange protein [Sphingomicrobium sp.]